MKTKLLLLLLVIFSFGKAQVTFSENFDAATPDLTGWVFTDFTIGTSVPCSGTKSLSKDFNAVNSTARVTTKNYVSNGGNITFTHSFKMLRLASGGANPQYNFILGYSVNNGPLVTVWNLSGGYVPNCSNGFTMTIPASAVPAGSNVKIIVQYEQSGTTFRLGLDNFAAIQAGTLATVENNFQNNETSIYPNPASDFVIVKSKEKLSSVDIFTMEGRKVLSSKDSRIETSSLQSGVYLIKIVDAKNNTTSKKLIIK